MNLRRLFICFAVPLVLAAQAEIARNGVVNAASPGVGISADSRVLIRGIGLAGPVRIDGREIPVISESKTLIEAWFPPTQTSGVHTLEVGAARRSITIARRATGLYAGNFKAKRGQTIAIRSTGFAPSHVTIGGVSAQVERVVARERGIRDLLLTVPLPAPEGCSVPLSANESNFLTISIGDPCPMPDFLPVPGESNGLIALVRNYAGGRVFDEGWALFARDNRMPPVPPSGTCNAFVAGMDDTPWTSGFTVGPWINVASGDRRKRLPAVRGVAGLYHGLLGGDDGTRAAVPLFFDSSRILIESSGNPPFRASLPPPGRNLRAILPRSASRKAGLEVVWPKSEGTAVIALVSKNVETQLRGGCLCVVPAGQGRFRIPAPVLSLLPADDSSEIFVARFDTGIWKRIDGAGLDALYAAILSVDSRLLKLD